MRSKALGATGSPLKPVAKQPTEAPAKALHPESPSARRAATTDDLAAPVSSALTDALKRLDQVIAAMPNVHEKAQLDAVTAVIRARGGQVRRTSAFDGQRLHAALEIVPDDRTVLGRMAEVAANREANGVTMGVTVTFSPAMLRNYGAKGMYLPQTRSLYLGLDAIRDEYDSTTQHELGHARQHFRERQGLVGAADGTMRSSGFGGLPHSKGVAYGKFQQLDEPFQFISGNIGHAISQLVQTRSTPEAHAPIREELAEKTAWAGDLLEQQTLIVGDLLTGFGRSKQNDTVVNWNDSSKPSASLTPERNGRRADCSYQLPLRRVRDRADALAGSAPYGDGRANSSPPATRR
ncbi:MAG: hypothetical protein IPJ65_24325 [Archangiaceae bacterium]|nr:hypothetical protein [Archangiaceae bacterium]